MHTTAWWLTLPHEMLAALPFSSTDRMDGVRALGNVFHAMAILLVMCDARDLGVAVGENSRSQTGEGGSQKSESSGHAIEREEFEAAHEVPDSDSDVPEPRLSNPGSRLATPGSRAPYFEPNIYLYDKYPGGIGMSEPLYRMSAALLENARKLIENCDCEAGCPSCVGPAGEIGEKGKEVALSILRAIARRSE
jgi:DEAD/DEAH box helicase domain-containing protein